ncbi:MAG: 3-oxoacyl-[acyl-carrier-protein] reductase [Candidatus Alcyoniella australis]|nr:3-oxoacyl-[acyl-carrier-protein] reductase [Candidatus Alcyoniella australis]
MAGRSVLVTGASKGIGAACAARLAEPEGTVWINYHSDEVGASDTAQRVKQRGARAELIKFDVSDPDGVKKAFTRIKSESKGLDVLVNNAGISRDQMIALQKVDDFDRVLAVNLRGAYLCSQQAARLMIRQHGGRIVNVSSVVGLAGNAGQSAYAASKAGLIGLTLSLARELAGRGITVNAVAPGWIQTAMTADLDETTRLAALKQVPLGRPGRPEDVAAAVEFLASEQAAYITGQVLRVDGGMSMRF